MADNVTLNAGTGGANLRTLADASGVEWPAAVLSYVTTLSPGANVLTPVSQDAPLPVDASIVGNVVVASVTAPVAVVNDDAASLLATVNIASGQLLATVGSIASPVAVTQSGTWNAGLSAGSNLIGKAAVGADTSTIYNGATALTPKFVKISASASGDNVVVAAVTGKMIRVLEWGLAASGTVGIKWRSNTTDITGVRPLVQYASAGGSYSPIGRFQTAAGEALNINLSAAIPVGGDLAYIEV